MKISLYDRSPVFDTAGDFDDSDLLKRFEQRAMEFNRPGGFVDALRVGAAGFLRSLVPNNNIEADRIQSLIGNEQERMNDPIGRNMSQAEWDSHMRENAQSARYQNFMGLRSLTDYIEPTPHAEPDTLLGKVAYKAGEYIPGIAGSIAEFMTLGWPLTVLLNSTLGTQNAQEQVYDSQLNQGQPIEEARAIATKPLPNLADFGLRGMVNAATIHALGKPYPGFNSGISPIAHTLRNIGMASGISGAGAMGEQALTNYRSDKDNNIGDLANTGAGAAAVTGIIGLTLAGLRAKKLIEAQRAYNQSRPINAELRDITPPDEPPALGDGNSPKTPPQSPLNGTDIVTAPDNNALPQGTLQLPEFTSRNIAARLNNAVVQRGFNPITNDFQPNALARQIATYVGNGYMSQEDALSMLQEGGLSAEQAKGFLDTGVADILVQTRPTKTTQQPTEIILDRIANHPQTDIYRRAYEDYANLDEAYSDFGGDNSAPFQDFPDETVQDSQPDLPKITVLGFKPNIDKPNVSHIKPDMRNVTASKISPNIEKPGASLFRPDLQKPNVVRGLDGLKDILQPPQRVPALGETQQPKATITFDEALRKVAERLYQEDTNKPGQWKDIQNLWSFMEQFPKDIQDKIYDYFDKHHITTANATTDGIRYVVNNHDALNDILQPSRRVSALGNDTPDEIAEQNFDILRHAPNDTAQKNLKQDNSRPIPPDAQSQQTQNDDPYTTDDPIGYTREDHPVEQRQIAIGRAQARHFLEKTTKQQLSSVAFAPHEIAINDTQRLQGFAFELGIQNAENITDRDALIQAINNKTQELISQEAEKRRNAREQSEQTQQTQPHPVPPDTYLKEGILAFSYYPEGSKRKQDVRFTSKINATGDGHKSIHLKSKKFGEYVYDAGTGEISYRGNNPEGEKLLPTVKKEFLRQIKDFYVDKDKNSNGLPVLKKGDIAIQGRNSRLQTQDAIILRPRNLNHNDGKFDIIAVSNNGFFAGTLAHHGTFEGHSFIPDKSANFSKEYVAQVEELIRSELRKKLSIIPERAVIRNKTGYIDISDMEPPFGSEVRITRDNSKFTVIPHPKSRFFTFHMQNSKKKKPYAYYYPDTDSFMLEEDERDRGVLYMLEKRFREKIKDFYYGGDDEAQQPVNDSKTVTPQTETTEPQTQKATPEKARNDNETKILNGFSTNTWVVSLKGEHYFVYPYGASNMEKFREWIVRPDSIQLSNEQMMFDAYRDIAHFTEIIDDDKQKTSNTPAALEAIKKTLINLYREENGDTFKDKQSKKENNTNADSNFRVLSFDSKPELQAQNQPAQGKNTNTTSSEADSSGANIAPVVSLANRVKSRIIEVLNNDNEDNDITPFSNNDLLKLATQEFGGTKGQGAFDPREAYDAMEMGINMAIAEAGITPATAEDTYDAINDIQRLLRILQDIPTQTNRTKEQVAFQQFSTPPTLAYLVNWLAGVGSNNIALEPSAGTGNLAVFAHNAGAGLILNDYSKSGLRADILDALDWGEVYRKDALDIADILLPKLNEDERPDRVIMNPPFSAAGKQGTANSNQNGFQHVEQALQLLKDNGRLVAILGAGRDGKASSVKNWLKHIGKKYNVRALITVGGKAYQRYGTTFDNAIVVIDKTGATPKGGTMEYSFSGDFGNDEELYKLFNSFTDIVNDYKDRDEEDNYYFAQSEYEAPYDFLDEEDDETDEYDSPYTVHNLDKWREDVKHLKVAKQNNQGHNHPANHQHNGNDEPDNDSNPSKNEPPKLSPAPKNNTPKAEATHKVTENNPAREQESSEHVTQNNPQKKITRKEAELPDEEESTDPESASIYSDYEPQQHSGIHLFNIAKPHPSPLVETTNMKTVPLPPLTYSPHLPDKMIQSGAISESQLEAVAYAGQAFTQKLPSGQTKGFILGDGTGSGKGRTIAAIITDQLNQNHGGGKAVWFSVSADLFKDAQRDLDGIGEDKKQLFELAETKLGDTIPTDKKGIMFTTYNTLISTGKKKSDDNDTDNDSEDGKSAEGAIDTKRIKQIVDWLGQNFDGVIAFDECHKINNLGGEEAGFGKSKSSKSADAARMLADALPHAKILYVSATSATDPNNLRMFDRTGLWGENTPFANADKFAAEIRAGGPNAMEMFARDAKSLGIFVARSLSPNGLTYRRLNYTLSKAERDMYNEIAQAWRLVDDAITQGFQAVGGDPKSGKNDKGLSAKFRGRQLQCFNFLLTAFKTNALIEDARKQLDDGNSVVIQIDSTYDAFIDRILKGKQADDDLRDVIISPVEDLIGFVMDYFPIHKMRQVVIERQNGDNYIANEIVKDDETGKPVVSQEALKIRNTLIAHLKRVRFNMSPLDQIINSLGGLANVAEITRRKHRLIKQADGKIIDAKQPPSANKEVDAFNNSEKRVIIFSRAGNTGRSFHADKSFKNSQRRIHYLLEGGFSAFNAIQGFGRTHRSNELSQPEYVVLAADIPGEIRFISAIVRKLGQMGALTAGDRKNNTQGLYSEKDNMESRLAAAAMNHVMHNLLNGAYPEFPDGREVIRQMGFDPDTFGMKDIPLKRIFNRLLSLDLEVQDVLISYFSMEHEQLLLTAIQNGTADIGTENIRALNVETLQDKTILEDKTKGIKTRYLELKVKVKSRIRPFENVTRVQHCEEFFIDQEGTIYAAKKNGQYETDEEGNSHFRPSFEMKNGEAIQRYTLFTTDMKTTYATDQLALQNKKQSQKKTFSPVTRERAKKLWQQQSANMEKSHFENIHMISGVLLPIWNQLKRLKSSRVKRVILPNGTSIIGRTLENSEVQSVLRSFGVNYEGKKYSVQDILRELEKPKTFARLFNNWKLKYSTVSGEKRIEILYNDYHDIPRLESIGALVEIIGSDERAFVPVGNNDILHAITTFSKVVGFENDLSADDILDEAAQKINSNIPDSAKLYFIHNSFNYFFNNPEDNPYVQTSNYPMDNPESEKRYQTAKHADSSKSVWQHLKEFGSKVWKGRHDIPELADEKGKIDDSLIKAQELLRGLKRERQANVHETEKLLRAALLGLSPDDFDLFQRAMELRDLYETRNSDPNASMPWGLNPKTLYDFDATDPVHDNYKTIMEHVRKNPRVQEAMSRADVLMENLRNKLIEAADRLAMFDVRDRLKRKHYFRHLVLEYYNAQRSGKPHPTFKNPERRGYMKHREGSDKDISSNWILAMGEVFTRMNDDIKILDTLSKLRQHYDIFEKLKQEAFQINMNNALAEIMKGLKDVPDELRKSKAEEQLQAVLQARQARAINKLFKLAQNGDLPIGNNNEWQELTGRMADSGQLEKLSHEEQQKLSRYIGWLSTLTDKTIARSAARSFLAGTRSKNAALKRITGNNFVDWKDLIPDDYTLWSPSDSRLVFSASTTPEYMLKIAMDNIDELLGVHLSDLGKAIASGGNKQLWCIPERLADALDNIGKSQPQGAFGQIMGKFMGAFKRWVTIGPANGRLFKYNWRNFFGDVEAVLQGNPGALYYFNQAAKELTDVMLRGGIATGRLEEFQKRGGGLTTESMTELERPDRIKAFSHLFEQKKTSNPLKWGINAFREYLYIATTLTNFRESILRYAAFLSYIQLIKDNNGIPPFYGMSKPHEVKAVGDNIYDIAFKLANENLGAYDQVSANVQWLRDNNFMSFISWVEVNTKRTIQMYNNIWTGNSYLEWWIKKKGQKFIDGLIGSGNGNSGNNQPPKNNNGGDFSDDNGDNEFRKLFRRVAKKSAVGALRLAITLAMTAPLWGMLKLWNMLNGENDEKLPPDVRNKPHLTIGTNAFTGEITYMGDIGSAFDALQMFGIGNLITGDLRDLFDGRASFGEVAANIIDGPVSKIVSNTNPFAKAIVESLLGKRTFPSALHPSPIRDKGRFIAQSFGLEWYYDFLTDKPHKPFYNFSSSVVNTTNQDSSAYFYMLSRRKQFEENVLGKSADAFIMTKRGEALRNAKRAADLGDRETLRKYLREYFRAGGSEQGLKISARTMEPLYGLNDTDEMRFIRWLPKEERKILRRAMRYAERMKARLGVW